MRSDGLGTGAQSQADRVALRIDAANALPQRGEERLRLSPRAFAVLDYLAKRAGKLLEKDELRRCVWRGASVSDGALVVCIRELREALGDDARRSRYIETVHRRGYRFMGALSDEYASRPLDAAIDRTAGVVIGRESELAALCAHLNKASCGEPQMVFVAGDPREACATLGLRDQGFSAIDEAAAMIKRNDECWCEARAPSSQSSTSAARSGRRFARSRSGRTDHGAQHRSATECATPGAAGRHRYRELAGEWRSGRTRT